ncbi:hypothetical protein J2Z35_002468 [Acetoanaerobium pronyense]|uniref:DUF3098 domain-containing protein n=1 Tax=Acetoanaerobium pronyense TaxID=1482736 RepID=A0ABS4KLH3_9FIRM|nr:hypothetical protein [Acetoanaerobium pronyense]MBP2028638.1 hypothetical protein [Acetoanaerobium pronyense]
MKKKLMSQSVPEVDKIIKNLKIIRYFLVGIITCISFILISIITIDSVDGLSSDLGFLMIPISFIPTIMIICTLVIVDTIKQNSEN